MPKYRIKTPTGETYDVTAPEGASQDDVLAYAQQHHSENAQPRISPQDAALYSHNTPKSDPIIDRIRGNPAEQIPSIYDPQFDKDAGWGQYTGIKPSIASLLGNDENVMAAVLKATPGAQAAEDANGNAVVQLPDGKRYYVNQPGLDMTDVGRAAGKAAAFVPAAAAAATGKTTPLRMLLGGLASGGTDAAMQLGATAAGGNPDLNPTQTALAGGIGAGAEAVPALLGSIFRGGKAALTSDSALARLGQQVATDAEIPGQLTQSQLVELGRRYPQIRAGASPESALAESEFGFRLTQGQKTGDIQQLRREEMLRASGGDTMASRAARNVATEQERNLSDQAQRIQDYLAGGASPSSPAEAAQSVIGGVRQQAADLSGRVDAAYDAVRGTNAAVNIGQAQALPQRLVTAVRDYDITPELTPATYRQLGRIQDELSKLPPQTTGVTLRAVEANRKILNNAIGSAANATDKAALTRVKGAFDDWLGETFDNALISGDPQALETLKQARALRAEYGMRFQPKNPNDQGGKIVKQLLDDNATPDQMAQAIFGSGQLAPRASASIVQKLKGALGSDVDTWNAVRSAFINRAVVKPTGETLGPQAIVSNLGRFLRERPDLARQLYSQEEVDKLKRFATAMSVLVPPKEIAKSSGTAERALAFFNEYLRGIPLGKSVMDLLAAPVRARTAAQMMRPVTSPVSAGYTAVGSGIGNTLNQNRLLPGTSGLYSNDEAGK